MTKHYFSRNAAKRIDWKTELPRYVAARAADEEFVVTAADKKEADDEIIRRVNELEFASGRGEAAAWKEFNKRALARGTEERALLEVSMRGVLDVVRHPSSGAG